MEERKDVRLEKRVSLILLVLKMRSGWLSIWFSFDRIGKQDQKWTIFNGWTSERVENFLFRATREYTAAGIEQATVAMRCLGANSPEPRRRAVPGWHVSRRTSSYITARPWLPRLIMGPCPSEESVCCPCVALQHHIFEGLSFLGLLTIRISPVGQCALVL